ncbi:L,D-transpeptidase family protein [Olsenella porci]|uniref:L,D-transpeptidase family protein n=1 Tax=Olsenella porci TaxID=2652279 RepID=UPI002DDC0E63|nr:L,D-transpeptidase family protein [Olsenella porci]
MQDDKDNRQGDAPEGDPAKTVLAPKPIVPTHLSHDASVGAHHHDGPSRSRKQSRGDRPHSRKGGIPKGAKVALVCAGVVGGVYLGGVVAWSRVLMPNTTVNGEDASLKTAQSVAEEKASTVSNYSLAVSGEGLSLTVGASDIDYASGTETIAQAIQSASNAWLWPVKVARGNNITVSLSPSYDKDKLTALVKAAVDKVNASATAPTNATIAYDSSSKTYAITAEQQGTALDESAVEKAVEAAIDSGQTTLELGSDSLQQPTVTKDDENLKTAASTANSYLAATQTLTVNGSTAATVDADTISKWVSVGDDLSVSLDTNAITTWATGDLSKQYDTVGTSRTYTTPYGKQVTVSGGTYGWVLDGSSLAQSLAANIQAGKAASVEIPWKTTAATYNPGGADWGSRYIDCDLSEQHVRMYDESGNLIWESDCVSGNTSKGHGTPEGVYTIDSYMGTNQTLIGEDENGDGEPDYKSQVSYWMPFVGNMVAFHDASWRSSFGGTIYQTDGSHGCVNLPSDAAKTLYSLVKVGDVVVVHS